MMHRLSYYIVSTVLLACVSVGLALFTFFDAGANTLEQTVTGEEVYQNVRSELGGGSVEEGDPIRIASSIINFALGFLGIIAVALILFAGWKWMTAAGVEDQVGEAKKLLMQAVIGLIIVMASWGLAGFIITQLYERISSPGISGSGGRVNDSAGVAPSLRR